jgi:hypothetical protein
MNTIEWSQTAGERAASILFVYGGLKGTVIRTRSLVEAGLDAGDVNYVAWLIRNLVELRVWVEYCSVSDKNALEFHEDSVRDLIELDRRVGGMDDETKVELGKAKAMLQTEKPDHKFKSAREAAAEVGLSDFFKQNNKVLSKFAHPTALSVMSNLSPEARQKICKGMSEVGFVIADAALAKLDGGLLGEAYRQYLPALKATLAEFPELQADYDGLVKLA